MAATILQEIVQSKQLEVENARVAQPLEQLRTLAKQAAPPRDFWAAVTAAHGKRPRLIAEIKRQSPSAGVLRHEFDLINIAITYHACGAAALSVLTDYPYFGGSIDFIQQVKGTVDLPILRKDFIIDEYQVLQSRVAGADAVLLIAAILNDDQLDRFSKSAFDLGMTTLLEIHDENEWRRTCQFMGHARRVMPGINNRDLAAQRIDLQTTSRLAALLPPNMPFVAESGLKSRDDVTAMARCGAAAVLIGEVFMRADNIAGKVHEVMNTDVAWHEPDILRRSDEHHSH